MLAAAMCCRMDKAHKGKMGKKPKSQHVTERFLHTGISALQKMTAQVTEISCHLLFHATIISL